MHAIAPRPLLLAATIALALSGCQRDAAPGPAADDASIPAQPTAEAEQSYAGRHAGDYATVPLKADLSAFDADGKRMIALLVQASQVMDELYWKQSWEGDRDALLAKAPDEATRDWIRLNFGPWDRLNGDEPMLPGIGPRAPGGVFYPADMDKAEFEQSGLADKASWYTLLRRDDAGALVTVPYHVAYKPELERAAALLREASHLSEDRDFGEYLAMRADALLSDDFQPSDMAWMDMKHNPVDVVIGPIESYEDQLFGFKTA